MAKISHNIEYFFSLLGCKIAQNMSFERADRFGVGLGNFAHAILTSRKRIAADNLRRAMKDSLSEDDITRIVRLVFQNIGRTMVEFSRLNKITHDVAREFITSDCSQYLKEAYDHGKGGIVVTGHFGNWELGGAWITAQDYPVDYLVGAQHNVKIDNMFIEFRKQLNVGIIPLRTSIRAIFKSLKANRFVCLVSDQHASSGGVAVEFFGRKAATPKGPAMFAVKANSPILPFMCRRINYNHHEILGAPPIYPPNSGDVENDVKEMTTRYTKFFEDCIRQYPDQWMWTHRRWKLNN